MMDYKRKCYWENIKLLVLQDVSHQVNQDITRIRSLHSPIIQGLSLQCSVRASWRELHVCRPLGYCQVNINLMIDYARAKHKCNRLTTCILWIWMSPYGVEKRLIFFDVEARVIIINTEDENKSSQVKLVPTYTSSRRLWFGNIWIKAVFLFNVGIRVLIFLPFKGSCRVCTNVLISYYKNM